MKVIITLFMIFISFSLNAQDILDEPYMDAFIVISDTSEDYSILKEEMIQLNKNFGIEIDTMGRGYDRSKNRICLPDNDEDEIYAGNYFPRRYSSETLSLEYLDYYKIGNYPTRGMIALVVMITDKKEEADEKLRQIKNYSKAAFILNSKIYMGCMH